MRTFPVRVLVLFALIFAFAGAVRAQAPAISGLVDGAMNLPAAAVAPGQLVTLLGTNLADPALAQCTTKTGLPITCANVTVAVGGKAAPLVYVSATQVSLQIPAELTGTSAAIQLTRQTGGQTLQSGTITVTVAPVAPTMFAGQGAVQGIPFGTFLNAANAVVSLSNPIQPGDHLIAYGTGFGATNPAVPSGVLAGPAPVVATVTATVGGKDVLVALALMVQPGLYQVNFQVPAGLTGNQLLIVTVGGKTTPPVLLPIAAPKPAITGVGNAASGAAAITAGSWVAIYGANLAPTTREWQAPDFVGTDLPTALDKVSVKINGKPAAVSFISSGQVNVQAPDDSALGTVQVELTNPSGTATGTATLATYSPGFFTYNNKYAAAVHLDGTYVAPAGYFGSTLTTRPAQSGETIVIYGTGFGPTNPAVPAGKQFFGAAPITDLSMLHMRIGGVAADVKFAGLTVAGEFQFNVVVPAVSDGDQPLVVDIAGQSAATVLIPIKN